MTASGRDSPVVVPESGHSRRLKPDTRCQFRLRLLQLSSFEANGGQTPVLFDDRRRFTRRRHLHRLEQHLHFMRARNRLLCG